jgi:N-acetylglutamate synthase-like GNAT family acetyltransferase
MRYNPYMTDALHFRKIANPDKGWMAELIKNEWGSTNVVSRGKLHDVLELQGYVAEQRGKPVGLLTYLIDGENCELVTLNSMLEGKGVATGLIEGLKKAAREQRCRRIWAITTNDNTDALRFYQKRGFTLSVIYPNAMAESRKLKPQIPVTGMHGIPIRDEIELELSIR